MLYGGDLEAHTFRIMYISVKCSVKFNAKITLPIFSVVRYGTVCVAGVFTVQYDYFSNVVDKLPISTTAADVVSGAYIC